MTLTATADPTNSRVLLAASSLPNLTGLNIYIDRQVPGGAWTGVRGASPATPNATTLNVSDYEFTPNVVNSYRVRTDVAYDLFSRTVSNGWTTLDSGQTWVTGGGAAANYAVGSGFGSHTVASVNVIRETSIVNITVDTETVTDIAVSAIATGASLHGAVVARRVDASNYFFADVEFRTDSTLIFSINKRTTGTDVQLATYVPTITYTAGASYRIRFKVQGTSIFAKIWDPIASPTEPGAYQLIVSDNSVTSGSGLSARSIATSGNTNSSPQVRFDMFHSGDLATTNQTFASLGTATVTPPFGTDEVWLKFPLRPYLNRQISLCNWSPEVRPARGQLFDVLGRRAKVAVTDVRGGREFDVLLVAADANESDAIESALNYGDVVYIQTPGVTTVCSLAKRNYPASIYGYIGGSNSELTLTRVLDSSVIYVPSFSITEAAAPDPSLLGSSSTWGGIIANFATWAAVQAQFPNWLAVQQYVQPNNVIVG